MSTPENQTQPEPVPSSGAVGDAATVPPTSDDAAPGTSEEQPVVQGIHTPEVRSTA